MNPDKVVTQIKNLGEFIKNNQNSDGSITIPTSLRPYMNNLDKI